MTEQDTPPASETLRKGDRMQSAETPAPALFVSHGAPDIILSRQPAKAFLQELGRSLPRPVGIVVVSAHWESRGLAVTQPGKLATIHDFRGFPQALYDLRYDAEATPDLVANLKQALEGSPLGPLALAPRGLDHGAWVPLMLMYPEADIPVAQLSLPKATPRQLFRLGRLLAPLREEGVMIIGSGGAVHNLMEVDAEGSPAPQWAVAFDNWVERQLMRGDRDALFDYEEEAPQPFRAHPTNEHFAPLFVALGAGGEEPSPRRLHYGFTCGSVSMACYAF